MAEMFLTQMEADILLAMPKIRTNDEEYIFPWMGSKFSFPLSSQDKRENFLLDIWRSGSIELKGRYQNRARSVITLVRLDFGGSPHRNPDDAEVPSPHIHIYREGFGSKWAYPIPLDKFSNPEDMWTSLQEFMKFCNIIQPPNIIRGIIT
ncbi:MAG: hypothetical protein MUO31_13900 [Thermodesulfovibrionales bacterium]|nr:hypothetical protein [Thermodesulfovibrionales bacterium]